MKLRTGLILAGLSLCSSSWAAGQGKTFASYCSQAVEKADERLTLDALARLVSVRTPVAPEYCEFLGEALAERTRFTLRSKELTSLKVFAYLPATTEIVASRNSITSLEGLENLSQLELLDLGSNDLSDISALKKLEKLQVLRLADNRIVDIGVLQHLTALRDLSIGSNRISDVKALGQLESLQYVNLSTNALTSVDALVSLPQIQTLNIGFNRICEFSLLDKAEKKGLTLIGRETQTCD